MARNVAVLLGLLPQLGGGHGLVQERSGVFHRLQHMQSRRQDLILDLDQPQSLFRNVGTRCRHRRHRVALVEGLIGRHDVVAQEFHVHRHLTEIGHAIFGDREILDGDDRLHAWQRLRLGGVNGLNTGMGMRAAEHLAVQHAGQAHIAAIHRPARDLIRAIGSDRAGTNYLICCSCFCHYAFSITVAASRTARTILSYPVQRHRFPANQ